MWLTLNAKKIAEVEAELETAKKYQPMKLANVLDKKEQDVKNEVYKSLLKISLAADFANDCVEETKSVLSKLGLNDFTLRADVAEMCKLSQKIASFVIIPNQRVLTDMIVDNDDFISTCHNAADKHLKETLNL